jgi:hypothetical protein
MTARLRSSKAPCRWSRGAGQLNRFGMAFGALAALFLAIGTSPALAIDVGDADPLPDRVYAECVLSDDAVEALVESIEDVNSNNPNDAEIVGAVSYVVVYVVGNDNNGQEIVDDESSDFTGPAICINDSEVEITPALQTDDIPDIDPDIDILDLQDGLILRHAPAGDGAPGANRICHTTDGNTDCFDID